MSDVLALMSRDDADEILVDVFTLAHKWAKKYTATVADEMILQAALDRREVRLWILERLGFPPAPMELMAISALPLFENVATLVELAKFLKEYGPVLRDFIKVVMDLINAFKGIKPSVPAGEVGDGGIRHPKF